MAARWAASPSAWASCERACSAAFLPCRLPGQPGPGIAWQRCVCPEGRARTDCVAAPRRLRRYAAPKVSPLSLVATAVAWLTALSVVALVPIDVYATLSGQETPAISTLWSVSYWCG